jgi:hypothetical protein
VFCVLCLCDIIPKGTAFVVVLVTRFRVRYVQSVISAPFLYPIIQYHRNTEIL